MFLPALRASAWRRCPPAAGAQVERNLRRVYGPDFRGRSARGAPFRRTFESYARYWVESFRLPGTSRRGARRRHVVRRAGTTSRRARGGQGRDPRPPAPRRLGVGGVLVGRGRSGVRSPWSSSRWTRRSCSSGSPTCVESFGMNVVPLGPDAGTAVVRALKANHVVCLLCDREHRRRRRRGRVLRRAHDAAGRSGDACRCAPARRCFRWRCTSRPHHHWATCAVRSLRCGKAGCATTSPE